MKTERKRILVVDDEPSATALLELYLEKSAVYEVKVENTPTRVLAVAEQFGPDLIFLDVDMAGMDGGELASRFRSSPRFKGVPVVFLTAMVTKEEVSAGGGMVGGQPFLAKPVSRRDVIDCAAAHLGGRRLICEECKTLLSGS